MARNNAAISTKPPPRFNARFSSRRRARSCRPRWTQLALAPSGAKPCKSCANSRTRREALCLSLRNGIAHFALGEEGQGFDWLTKAFQDRCFELICIKVDPRMSSLWGNRQFQSLFQQLGLP